MINRACLPLIFSGRSLLLGFDLLDLQNSPRGWR